MNSQPVRRTPVGWGWWLVNQCPSVQAPRWFMACVLILLGSCAPGPFDDPIAVMIDRDVEFRFREAAALQAQRNHYRDAPRITALETLTWDPGYPTWQRRYAIDQLIELDEPRFRSLLGQRITRINDWDTLEYVFRLGIERRWENFTPVVMTNYARQAHRVPDDQRPERAVIERLNPGKTVEQVAFEVFLDIDKQNTYPQRVSGWELLNRIADPTTPRQWLRGAPPADSLVIDLQAGLKELHTLPRNREGVLWLTHLRSTRGSGYWDRIRTAVSGLSPQQRDGLEMRHLPVLLHLDPVTLGSTRSELMDELRHLLRHSEHHVKDPSRDATVKIYPQRLEDWIDQLAWGNLATIRWLILTLRDRALVAELFRQAELDRLDTTTEYGGVIDAQNTSPVAHPYEPVLRRHDRIFYPPGKMIEHMYTAVAHYHFHAQSYENHDYASPGTGDLKTIDRINPNGLVLTFIDRDRLNVDYYQPGGIVIDLGTLRR